MPMKRHLYPSNWRTIAFMIKAFAGWECQNCGRPCRRPQESIDDFGDRLCNHHPEWLDDVWDGGVAKWGRFVLTVAHLDQNPGNNRRDNLKALCPKCHLRHDAPFNAIKASKTKKTRRIERLEDCGQMRIDGL